MSPQNNNTNSLLFKMQRSISDLKIANYSSYSDININYRGYESYRAYMTYKEGSTLNLLFGHGAGKSVDLKVSILLAGINWNIIPWVHNGYFFVLVKEGLLGLLALFLLYLQIFRIGVKNMDKSKTERRFKCLFIISCTLTLLITNYVVCSMFTVEMAIILITIGVLIQELETKEIMEIKSL